MIADDYHTIIFADKDEIPLIYENYNVMNLTEDLVMSINHNFDSWVKEWIGEPFNPYLSDEERTYMDQMHWQGLVILETERLEMQLKTALRETESAWLKRKWKQGK